MSENEQSLGRKKRLSGGWRFAICVLVAVGLIAAFYGEENWRGKHEWDKFRAEMTRRGAPVEPEAVIPPRVADDENFAQTPFLAPLFDFEPGSQHWRDTNGMARAQNFAADFDKAFAEVKSVRGPRSNSWVMPSPDLAAFNAALHGQKVETQQVSNGSANPVEQARGVLEALQKYDPILDELRNASQRPYSRFNLKYENEDPAAVLLPHLAVLKHTVQILRLRAHAELTAGLPDRALDDLDLSFKVIDSTRTEPIIISLLVRTAELQLTLQPLGEGLEKHQWSEPQLAKLQERLQQIDFCADARHAFEGERVLFGAGLMDYIRKSRNQYETIKNLGQGEAGQPGNGFDPAAIAVALVPDGWLYLEKVNYERSLYEHVLPLIQDEPRMVNPDRVRQEDTNLQNQLKASHLSAVFHHRILMSMLLPALSRVAVKTAYGQTAVDEARLACALERFRLKNGSYPEKLEQLVPQFVEKLPPDIVTGEPLRYHRTDDSRFVLYSVGWNKTDDGGQVTMHGNRPTAPERSASTVDEQTGDWVWR